MTIPELCEAVRCEIIDMLKSLQGSKGNLFSEDGRETLDHCERIIALLRQIERIAKEKEADREATTAD